MIRPLSPASIAGGALARTGWCWPLRHPSHPRAWGWRAALSELGAASREAKSVYEGRPGHGHIFIDGGLAAVKASGAVYAVDNGLSDSPCQIRFRRVRIARMMDGVYEPRIVRARSGFRRIRIAIRLTSATHCHALPVGGR
jgi:hypothetical protein